jgi:hypothetical protein
MAGEQPAPNGPPVMVSRTELRVTKLPAADCSVNENANGESGSLREVESQCDAICEKREIYGRTSSVRWALPFHVGRW